MHSNNFLQFFFSFFVCLFVFFFFAVLDSNVKMALSMFDIHTIHYFVVYHD